MVRRKELTLNGSWIIPTHTVYLSDNCLIHVEFKNNNTNSSITIIQVKYSFQTEHSLPKNVVPISQPCVIPPNNIHPLTIPFRVNLSMNARTNRPTFEVKYKVAGLPSKTVTFDNEVTCHVIINHIPDHQWYFFISHKIPIDTEKAKKLDHYLKKIGFSGYIAEENWQPGLHLWNEKILPQIENCMGLIVIWTVKASQEPQAICKEIEYAQDQNKRIMPLVEKNLEIPCVLQKHNERVHTNDKITELDLVKLVNSIHQMYMKGIFDHRD